jgi:hypothetical protein
MNLNNSNFVLLNLDSNFHEKPGFQKEKTLSKISMISRADYRLFSYLGQQWDNFVFTDVPSSFVGGSVNAIQSNSALI